MTCGTWVNVSMQLYVCCSGKLGSTLELFINVYILKLHILLDVFATFVYINLFTYLCFF